MQIANMLLLRNPRGTCVCGHKNDWLHIRQHVGILGGSLVPPFPRFFLLCCCLCCLLVACYVIGSCSYFLRRQTRRKEEDQDQDQDQDQEEEEEEGTH